MARIPYTGEGSAFRRLLNHSPAVSDGYWGLRKALDEGTRPREDPHALVWADLPSE